MPMPGEEPAVQRSRRGPTARVRAAQVLMWTAALTAALAAVSAVADLAVADLAGTTSTVARPGAPTASSSSPACSRSWLHDPMPPAASGSS